MTCAGSLYFPDLEDEDETSEPAREGTAFGEYMQSLIETGAPPKATIAKNGYGFDSDMEFYSRELIDDIRKNAAEQPVCEVRSRWQCNERVALEGQPDVSYIGRDGRLYIDDFKYGWRLVETQENWQLLAYAILEYQRRRLRDVDVVLRILQPRPHHEDGPIRRWELSADELLTYANIIHARMAQLAQGENTLVTSAACRYCPAAAGQCTAFNRVFYASIEESRKFVRDSISDSELANQLDLIGRADEVLRIRKDSLNALAINRIANGGIIPGYVTESKQANRSWKQGITPDLIKAITGKDVTQKEMLSPAKAEKLGIPKEVISAWVERPFLPPKLVKKNASDVGDKIFGKDAPGGV